MTETDTAPRAETRTWMSDTERPLVFRFEGVTRFVPLFVATGLFLVSWALLAVGPIDWHLVRPLRVHLFLAAATAALAGGYLFAVRRGRTPVTRVRSPLDASMLVIAASVVYLLLFIPVSRTTTGSWLPDVWGGLSDAGAAYARNKDLNESATPVFLYLRMVVAPLTILIFPLTLFLWPRLSRVARSLGVLCVLLSVALTVAQGINRGVAELCGQLVLFLVLVAASSLSRDRRGRLLRSLVGIVVVVGVFFAYYATTINSRIGADAAAAEDEGGSSETVDERMRDTALIDVATTREDHIYFAVVPESLQSEGLIFSSYLTHGYRGLSLAMDEDFTPTWGLGFSEFYRHNLLRVVGQGDREEAIEARTYAGKLIDQGWPDGMVWSTFFVHPASDIGFPGVIALMALIGFALGRSWRDTLERGDPLAAAVFFYLCILVFYLPANNQLFQGGELAIGFTVLTVVWLVLRRRGRDGAATEEHRSPTGAAG
ncbi:hypothetical protein SAMN05192575_1011009 [Nocardioides alpinus]|uniref:Oligosaccharide repeat unit polymerase n=1 Tax=Nocardioides alpinus TaxID=748909 RepID=A0A1I0WJB0_9ACTN|nr:hypothetical protein [Nocardioides alpinus]PKH37932.1 hypothetical protein CXG46_21355 [Nocardioides alpinus]SFA88073.1 hypothetical protein SAMN05192575_1011009 [Nocardioides alpinus]